MGHFGNSCWNLRENDAGLSWTVLAFRGAKLVGNLKDSRVLTVQP
jgi:hypothetical protein